MSMPKKRGQTRGTQAPACAPQAQTVLVLQGGGALGAFQVGAYQALCEAGLEPDWIIGTSIGAINAALIAGNPPPQRLGALQAFWQRITQHGVGPWAPPGMTGAFNDMAIMTRGVPGFFRPNPNVWRGASARVGLEQASYYDTAPLRDTLAGLIDVARLNAGAPRLTIGAVNVRSAEMRYFDSQHDTLGIDHIVASGALPPAFPAVRIDGESYWDGGIYSNTPIEAVFDDSPRRDSLIFAVNVWHTHSEEPESIAQVMERHKDIQYASRAHSHIDRQQQIHHLRHIVNELTNQLPTAARESAENRALATFGCRTMMHVVMLRPPHFAGEGATKDIDFSAEGIQMRQQSGYARTRAMLTRAPWAAPADPMLGVVVHSDSDNDNDT